jgi:16S rRNA (cytidine1402-2'-O)-methyltransferase
MPSMPPRLWVIATPLGNLGDLSPRAREILGRADLLLAEDTRRTGLLLKSVSLEPGKLLSLFEHNEEQRIDEVLGALAQGKEVALVSDAGTPLIADPGYRLVRACRQAGYPVSPVPGPSAVLAALMACGLPPYPFTFLGFLPRKEGERRRLFEQLLSFPGTIVFFERKSRVVASLRSAALVLGGRAFCLARELTKKHEQFINGRLGEDLAHLEELKGEMTVVIGPPEGGSSTADDEVMRILAEENSRGGHPREIVRRAQERVQGYGGKRLYDLLRTIRGNTG